MPLASRERLVCRPVLADASPRRPFFAARWWRTSRADPSMAAGHARLRASQETSSPASDCEAKRRPTAGTARASRDGYSRSATRGTLRRIFAGRARRSREGRRSRSRVDRFGKRPILGVGPKWLVMDIRVDESRPCRHPGLDHDHDTSRAHGARGLDEEAADIWYVVQDVRHHDGFEATGYERQLSGVENHREVRAREDLGPDTSGTRSWRKPAPDRVRARHQTREEGAARSPRTTLRKLSGEKASSRQSFVADESSQGCRAAVHA